VVGGHDPEQALRCVGIPCWVLTHHPCNTHYALIFRNDTP